MRLGIIGFPQSGKTTIFNALTRGEVPTTMSAGRIELHSGVVQVPDTRLERLEEIYNPKKTTPARIEYLDIAGLDGSAGQAGISGALLNELAQLDAFLHIVRCFEDENVAHQDGRLDASRDVSGMATELLFSDLLAVERKLERLADERQKGGRDKTVVEREQALFQRMQEGLTEEMPLRNQEFTVDEQKLLSSFGLLTFKPVMVVLNLGEGQAAPAVESAASHSRVVALQGKLEMEIAQLPPEETKVFLQEYGIEELSLYRIIRESYELLGQQTFFTGNEKEVRAWTVRRGIRAREAAGVVHTDMERGFIRAEVIGFAELDSLGSLAAAREHGKLRVEGKEYVVQDGEVIQVRFNV
ncbi:MAG: redox-regulated ATPase YchF [Chloroflexi bacterium]|nr:redox-regulated ATPase YchF [Chloroflexota bacterium]